MRMVKPIKKTSALSSVSPLRWAEDVDLTHISRQAWGIRGTPIKARLTVILI